MSGGTRPSRLDRRQRSDRERPPTEAQTDRRPTPTFAPPPLGFPGQQRLWPLTTIQLWPGRGQRCARALGHPAPGSRGRLGAGVPGAAVTDSTLGPAVQPHTPRPGASGRAPRSPGEALATGPRPQLRALGVRGAWGLNSRGGDAALSPGRAARATPLRRGELPSEQGPPPCPRRSGAGVGRDGLAWAAAGSRCSRPSPSPRPPNGTNTERPVGGAAGGRGGRQAER